jgi:hypothetical protein
LDSITVLTVVTCLCCSCRASFSCKAIPHQTIEQQAEQCQQAR